MIEQRLWLQSSHDLTNKIFRINWLFVLLLCALASVGYVALYSAGGAPEPYATRHIIRFAAGVLLMISIALVDIRFLARFSWFAYALGVALLVLVLKYGHVGKGAQRWLEIGGQQIQPSELMKLGLILALAAWFHRPSWEKLGNPLYLIPPLVAVLIPVGLILKEPNLGTAMITIMLGGVIFFAAGVRWWKFVLVLLPMPFAARYVYQHLHDYQRARIDTFMNPESDPLGAGYNIIQSKIALGSGGMWGKGFLQGTQGHLDFLPEKQTDFIFTMIGEEFGLVGAVGGDRAAGSDHLGRDADRTALQAPVWAAGRVWHRLQFLLLLFCEHRDGHGGDPGRRRAVAADIAWRLGDDHDDGRRLAS